MNPSEIVSRARLRVHKGRRAVPGGDARIDTLIGMVLALTSEVAVLRERVDAHERVAAAGGKLDPASIDDFEPDALALQARAVQRQRLIAKVCRPLLAEAVNSADADTNANADTNGD